jgi:serine/threonine protein kinase
LKIADFGSSKIFSKEVKHTKVGTIEVTAPEVLQDGEYSLKSDVYSFGILTWEFLFELPLYPSKYNNFK